MKKKPTIKDLAKAAHVSPTAVSMALNNRPRISPATRERILRIAKEVDYHPNFAARSLVSKKSQTIGFIITSIMNPFYPELAKGIEDQAREFGYHIMLCSTNEDVKLEKYHVENLRSKGVDGIIFSSVKIQDPNIDPLLEERFPFTLVNRRIHHPSLDKRIDYVVLDNFSGGAQAVEHLYRIGHRRIAVLAGPLDTSTALERTQGAKSRLKEYGIKLDPALFVVCHYAKELAYRATRKLLSLRKPPTAIFSENDYMALAARDAILDAGLRIPEDVSLMGFDDIAETALKGVEITTVSQKKYEMGTLAVKVLVEKIEKGFPRMASQMILEPELIIRKSCGFRALDAAAVPQRKP